MIFSFLFVSNRYIYAGVLDLDKFKGEAILSLLLASDELLLEELITHVETYLLQKRPGWIQKNMVEVSRTVFRLASCKKLQDQCLEMICEDPLSLFTLKNFSNMDKDILYQLLCRDDLQVREIYVW